MIKQSKADNRIKVLICDDSALIRVTLRKMIESDPGLMVLDSARNGLEAIEKSDRLDPDVIIMDINMPKLDGISALRQIVKKKKAPVIMFSALTDQGAKATMDALQKINVTKVKHYDIENLGLVEGDRKEENMTVEETPVTSTGGA